MYRVLVVDDESSVRELTSRSLCQVNLACDTAEDGQEAMELFEASGHDAVVTDLRMPRRNGHSLAVGLLGLPQPPKVVVVTGLVEPRLAIDLQHRGVENILYKPIDYGVLANKLLALAEGRERGLVVPPPPEIDTPVKQLMRIEQSLVELTSIFEDSLAGVFDFNDELSEPPKAIPDFVERFNKLEAATAASDGPEAEKRLKERVRCSRSVLAVPVTRRFLPCGEPFAAAIRDVSESGIRLLHTRSINASYLALKWRAETLKSTIHVVVEVLRCKPQGPFYGIAGPFVLAD